MALEYYPNISSKVQMSSVPEKGISLFAVSIICYIRRAGQRGVGEKILPKAVSESITGDRPQPF